MISDFKDELVKFYRFLMNKNLAKEGHDVEWLVEDYLSRQKPIRCIKCKAIISYVDTGERLCGRCEQKYYG